MRLGRGSGLRDPVQLVSALYEFSWLEVRVLGELDGVGLVLHLLGDGGPHGLGCRDLHVVGCWALSIHCSRLG